MDFMNPNNPISPMNPLNPSSPLNPINMGVDGPACTADCATGAVGIILIFIFCLALMVWAVLKS